MKILIIEKRTSTVQGKNIFHKAFGAEEDDKGEFFDIKTFFKNSFEKCNFFPHLKMITVVWELFSPKNTCRKATFSVIVFGGKLNMLMFLVYSPVYLVLSQRSKSLLDIFQSCSASSLTTQPFSFWLCKPYSKGSIATPGFQIMTSPPLPSWSEVKYGTVCIFFLSLHVVKPIPECVWEPCGGNSGWNMYAGIQGWLLQGTFCCPLLWVARAAVYPSSFLPSSWSCCLSQTTCSFPYLCPPWTPALDISFHFLLWLLPLLAVSLSPCFPAPPLDGAGMAPQAGAQQSCPLGAMGWWPASFPRSFHATGTELLVAACPGLRPRCRAGWGSWELLCPGSCPQTYQDKDLGMDDPSVLGRIVLIGLAVKITGAFWNCLFKENQPSTSSDAPSPGICAHGVWLGSADSSSSWSPFKIMSQHHCWNWLLVWQVPP